MSSVVKELIEYGGIVSPSDLPDLPTPASFKEFTVQETLTIPEAKPDIEQIIRVMAEAVITNIKVIQTCTGISEEQQVLTGWKALIEGYLNQKIEYVADEPTQSVHATHFKVPFSTFIVLSRCHTPNDLITVIPYIEDIYAKQIDKRHIFKNVTLLLHAI